MGYRPFKLDITNKIWVKQFGFIMFKIVEMDHKVIIQSIFKTFKNDGSLGLYDQSKCKYDEFNINIIKDFENSHLKTLMLFNFSEFEILTVKEILENDLLS